MRISENTPVTIGVIIALVGAIAFVTKTYYMAEASEAHSKVADTKLDVYNSTLNSIDKRLAIIEQILKERE